MTVWIQALRYSLVRSPSQFRNNKGVFLLVSPSCLDRFFHSRLPLSSRVPTVLLYHGTGISTCCPSATASALALGPDLPRADQLYPGILGYSAGRIPTFLSLLIPAFSLQYSPLLLAGAASSCIQCSSTNDFSFLSFGSVFQPRTFSAQDLSTSELLRTL